MYAAAVQATFAAALPGDRCHFAPRPSTVRRSTRGRYPAPSGWLRGQTSLPIQVSSSSCFLVMLQTSDSLHRSEAIFPDLRILLAQFTERHEILAGAVEAPRQQAVIVSLAQRSHQYGRTHGPVRQQCQ